MSDVHVIYTPGWLVPWLIYAGIVVGLALVIGCSAALIRNRRRGK